MRGRGAAEAFRDEVGGHRWQRVPPSEKRGRVQTSTVTVAVMEEQAPIGLGAIPPADLEWMVCRGSGAGGQHRNVTASAVQLRHLPTGLMVRCESQRSQHQNRQKALELLRARLGAAREAQSFRTQAANRRSQVGSGMRGDKRRTIRVRDDVVRDHITGQRWSYRAYARGDF